MSAGAGKLKPGILGYRHCGPSLLIVMQVLGPSTFDTHIRGLGPVCRRNEYLGIAYAWVIDPTIIEYWNIGGRDLCKRAM